MERRVCAIAGLVSVALALTAGCTAVLGMERATLDEDAGAGGATAAAGGAPTTTGAGGRRTSVAPWATTCAASDPCRTCLDQSCQADMAACLADAKCRDQVDRYGRCVQAAGCADDATCAEKNLPLEVETARNLSSCFIQSCAGACAGTILVSKCELYCECMSLTCDTQFMNDLGGSKETCLEKCKAVSSANPKNADCRWEHCEIARVDPDPKNNHCEHAMSRAGQCVYADDKQLCLTGQEVGLPCSDPSECCSQKCSQHVCVR